MRKKPPGQSNPLCKHGHVGWWLGRVARGLTADWKPHTNWTLRISKDLKGWLGISLGGGGFYFYIHLLLCYVLNQNIPLTVYTVTKISNSFSHSPGFKSWCHTHHLHGPLQATESP